MRDYLSSEVRNVAVLGHSGVGKTALLESMLFFTKASDRFGNTSQGSSLIDYDPEEIKRGLSVYASMVPIEWKECKINFVDTPGYFDFVRGVEEGLAVADNALIVVDGKDAIQAGTQRSYELAKAKKLPTIFFVNKLDEEHASFEKAYEELRNTFGKSVIPFEIPIVENGKIIGSVNVLRDKAWYYEGPLADRENAKEVPDDMKDIVAEYKSQIAEAIAMGDDDLMEKFFSGEEFSEAELTRGVRLGVRNGEITPVYSGSAINSIGIERLMDLIVKYFPTYGEQGSIEAIDANSKEEILIDTNENEAFVGQVFKTIVDPFVGRITYLKVLSGVLNADSNVYNATKDKMERVTNVYIIKGKHQTAVGKLFSGDIGAIVKLQDTNTNDTLCDKNKAVLAKPIEFSTPMLARAVTPKSKNDEDKMSQALARMVEEDTTLRLENNKETKETLLYGVGDQHLEVILNKLKAKYKVEVILSTPRVAYRETIRKKAMGEGRHKKQSGGHGQFGHVFVEFEPNDTSEEMVFDERVFGGAVPKAYFPAVEAGLRECMESGILAGCKVVNVKATLTDGKYHDVDSNEMAFKLAARLAYKDGMAKASPIMLEPIVTIKVRCPEEYIGTISGDFNKRRGQIMGFDAEDNYQIIEAQVPYAQVLDYAIQLRAMTQGRATYTQKFERYDALPTQLQDQVIAQIKQANEN